MIPHMHLIKPFFFSFTEDNYYGSGSGSGFDPDDNDDSGSGLGHYESPISPKVTVDQTTIDTTHKNVDINAGNTNNVFPGLDASAETDDTHSGEENTNYVDPHHPLHPHKEEDRTTAAATTVSSWKVKRILLTYFLPIVVAWFGGICTDLL